jgi:hypothetical protein
LEKKVTLLRWVETTKQVQFIVESQDFLADFLSGTEHFAPRVWHITLRLTARDTAAWKVQATAS